MQAAITYIIKLQNHFQPYFTNNKLNQESQFSHENWLTSVGEPYQYQRSATVDSLQ